ncbi:SusC/RagA family TonB-linked outer membrane protein [Muricauda oceani]|uniref:SusC/RagA family TonB-linked outer membrane protein n=1 Tax=Flagellimonas oceani TaxID=2698672 RepID=A0A6G7J2N3_9FLAO|nr:SusC/RagA family TonB-linked outer membrane protein [Allomuricauda oceani]MBW8244163.1 SusC/RagA family TonB-linked outer membrane protein [Allomuricauda oceani]QII45133.1 SusC/RagA family TonB-linked outer membrane protein [Allomuricauda oceani]
MQPITIRMRRGILSVLLYVFLTPHFSFNVQAGTVLEPPQATVTGTVTDSTGKPLAGVNLVVESKHIGTISGLDGSFSINAGPSDVLVFSMVGYKTLSVPIGGREEVFVSLEEDVTVLGEVVLNAGYYTVSEKERTGNIVAIGAEVIDKQPVGNPLAAMQGHLSGVNIVQNTGVPGGGFEIEVRGRNFINGVSDPLYIVDGVPFGSQSLGSTSMSSLIVGGDISPLNAINPNDIESVEVLKDADATAIYGSRGANGVVLITTKKGRAGKTRFDAHLSTSLGSVSHFLDLMHTREYLEVRREGIVNDGYGDLLNDPAFDFIWPELKTWDSERYTDWQEELIGGTAYRNNVQLSVSGGSAHTQFLVSGALQNETTVFPGDFNYKRASVHSNLNHRSKNGRFGLNLSTGFTHEVNDLPAADFTQSAYTLKPNAPRVFDEQGNLNWENNTWDNPLASLEETYGLESNTIISNAVLSYSILPDLVVKSSMGFTRYRLDSRRTLPSSARNPGDGHTPQSSSSLTTNGSYRESWIVEPQIGWKKQWGGFAVDILVGTSFQEETAQQLVQRGKGFPSDNLIQNLAAAETLEIITDTDSEYRYNALFGRVNLKFQDRYILNLTGRRDGSSRFGPGKQFGNFGAIGAAWLFSNETFLANSDVISYGKLRGSYGTTGSDNIGDYRFLDTYDVTGQEYDGTMVLEPTGIFNPLFGWEENRKLELAMELGFFKDRLLVNTSWYRNRSSNQLVGIPLAATTGFSQLTGNFDATVQNTGFEIDFRSINIKNRRFSWSTNFNITVPKNKLVAFDGLETSTFSNRYIIGEPLTIVKLYRSHGVDPETGSYDIEDYNGDGEISSLEDRQWVEDFAPELYGGLGNTLSLGNLSLDFFFQFKKQRAYNTMGFGATPGYGNNMPRAMLDRWREAGDVATYQRASGGLSLIPGTGPFQEVSNLAVSDASFVRLRNISLNYEIPSRDSGLDVNVYLQGQNLLTFTGYDGPDPEQPSNTRLPALRQITLGLQLSF